MPPDESVTIPATDATASSASPASGAEAPAQVAPVGDGASAAPAAQPSADAPGPVADAPAGEAAPAVALHTDTPTLLEQAAATEPAADEPTPKPTEAPKPAEEAKPAEPAVAEPVVYDLKMPEGIVADAAQLTAATDLFREHNVAPETAQKFVDLHTAALTSYANSTLEAQHRTFADTRAGWRTQMKADEQLGGAGYETTLKAGARVRDMFVAAKDMAAFNDMLRVTGVGDHPEFWRFASNIARFVDEPAGPALPNNPAPNAGQGGRPRLRDLYKKAG